MEVRVVDGVGMLLWSRNTNGGFTSPAYSKDLTLMLIRDALESALHQCQGELAVSDDTDRMADVCTSTP
jgi:hypothetical protein